LNGDMDQRVRERVVGRLKSGDLDIVVATDVAARGLDVDRVSHVVNYDIPTDAESYIHRIGRTGRAGRSGEAILFVSPRERHLLRAIERATRQPVAPMELPTVADVNDQRVQRFRDRIDEALTAPDLGVFRELIESYERERNIPAIEIAAALARVAHGDAPFFLAASDFKRQELPPDAPRREPRARPDDPPMDTFRLEIGGLHGVTASNIVGAIANELGVRSEFIGKIRIDEDHSLVDLPAGMPERVFAKLCKIRVNGRELRASLLGERRAPREVAPPPSGPSTDRPSSKAPPKAPPPKAQAAKGPPPKGPPRKGPPPKGHKRAPHHKGK